MPSTTPRPPTGYAVRAGCTALAAGLLALGVASPAGAADGDAQVELSFPGSDGRVVAEPFTSPSHGLYVQGRNTGTHELKNLSVTIDASALKGQIRMENQPCTNKSDLVIVCEPGQVDEGQPIAPGAKFSVVEPQFTALAGARPGFAGEVRVSVKAGGVLLEEKSFKASVADLGLYADRTGPDLGSAPRSKPGSTVQPVVGFRNFSTRTVNDVYVTLHLTQGLSFAEEFSNCRYEAQYLAEDTGMVCHIQGAVEPNAAYDLDMPALKVGATASTEEWRGSITEKEVTGHSLRSPHQGTGRELKLSKRAQGAALPLSREVYGAAVADTSRDVEAVGATVDGRPGQVVKVNLGLRNNGPATFKNWGDEPGDDASSRASVTLPAGTTALKVPDLCRAASSTAGSGTKRYTCHQDLDDFYFNAGQLTPFVFELRIDKPKALAPGSIEAVDAGDSHPGNDTARIFVTVDGKLGDGSVPAAGGTAGTGEPSDGATTAPGNDGSSPSPDHGGVAAGASGGTAHGPMADTGAGALPWYAAASALALAGGTVLVTVVRRRRAGRA